MFFHGNLVLTNLDGTPLASQSGQVLTLAFLAWNSLVGDVSDRALAGPEKLERYLLACRIYQAAGPLEISAAEAALIKGLINTVWASPLIVGQAWKIIDTPPVDNVVHLDAAE